MAFFFNVDVIRYNEYVKVNYCWIPGRRQWRQTLNAMTSWLITDYARRSERAS